MCKGNERHLQGAAVLSLGAPGRPADETVSFLNIACCVLCHIVGHPLLVILVCVWCNSRALRVNCVFRRLIFFFFFSLSIQHRQSHAKYNPVLDGNGGCSLRFCCSLSSTRARWWTRWIWSGLRRRGKKSTKPPPRTK